MSFDRSKSISLPDGRQVIGTLTAAHRLGVVPEYVSKLAKKHGLQRFGGKPSRGGTVAFYYLEDEVAQLAAERRELRPVIDDGQIIPMPFEAESN